MRYAEFLFIICISFHTIASSNPVDSTPVARFSELVFDEDDNWTLELYFPFEYQQQMTDSIVVKSLTSESRLPLGFNHPIQIMLVSPDSLSDPFIINREGDSLTLTTYSYMHTSMVRIDELIFGNCEGAGVGAPVGGYSIMRNTWQASKSNLTIDCLTKHSTLGQVNDTLGLCAKIGGVIYDINYEPVTKFRSYYSYRLHAPVKIKDDGTYTSNIFRKFPLEKVTHLTVKEYDFDGWVDSIAIDPIELNNIQPDTSIIMDIFLQDNDYVDSAVHGRAQTQDHYINIINYPNPFNVSTHFSVKISESQKFSETRIQIYNSTGQLVQSIPCSQNDTVIWNGTSSNGASMPSGLYTYELRADHQILKIGSMILLK